MMHRGLQRPASTAVGMKSTNLKQYAKFLNGVTKILFENDILSSMILQARLEKVKPPSRIL